MADKIMHFHLNDFALEDGPVQRIVAKIKAEVADMTDDAIVDACVKAAREDGISDLYLLDKKFVLDAIRDKIQGTRQGFPRWISVEDEYPDSKLKVLAIVYEDMYDMGEIKPCPAVHTAYTRGEDEGWFDWYTGDWLNVTHWMKVPEFHEEE